jgi:hypothetical protein
MDISVTSQGVIYDKFAGHNDLVPTFAERGCNVVSVTNPYGCILSFLDRALIIIIITYLLRGLSPQANYTDRATAACRRSQCQRLRIEGATWSA